MGEFSGKVSTAHSKPKDDVIIELEELLYLEGKKAYKRLELLREFRSTVKKEMGEVWSYFEDYNPGLIERIAEELGDKD